MRYNRLVRAIIAQSRARFQGFWLAVVAAGVIVRFATVARQPLWSDEAYSWLAASAGPDFLLSPSFHDRHPSLYYLLLSPLVAWAPRSELALRLPSLLASAGFLVLLAGLAHRWQGPRAAIWAALAGSLSSWELLLAQEARSYAILSLCWLATIALYFEAWRYRSPRLLFAAGVTNALLPALHALGIVAAGIHLAIVTAWLVGDREARRTAALRSAHLIGVVLVALSIAAFDLHLLRSVDQGAAAGSVPSWRAFRVLLSGLGAGVALASGGVPGRGLRFAMPEWIGSLLGIAVWALAAAGLVRWARRGRREQVLVGLLALSLVGPVAVTAGVGLIRQAPVWVPRIFSVNLVLLALGIAAFQEGLSRPRRALLGVALCGIWLSSWIPYFSTYDKSYRELVHARSPRPGGPNDALVVGAYTELMIATFYFPEARIWLLPTDQRDDSGEVRRMSLSRESLWPIVAREEDCREPAVETLWLWPRGRRSTRYLRRVPPDCRRGRRVMAWKSDSWRPVREGR